MQNRGKFITIEGIDGCGKSTLAQNLAQVLNQRKADVVLTKEPGGSPLGVHLRNILNLLQKESLCLCEKSEYLLFAADRAQHYKQVIFPALQQGKIVISDRWADSSVAYQGYGRGLEINMIKSINAWATDNLLPDMVLYVKIDPQTALSRIKHRHLELTAFEKEKIEFWTRVCTGYESMYAERKDVKILDGRLGPDELLQAALGVMSLYEI
jgi:dTMP kinase